MRHDGEQISRQGPWPFVTRRVYRRADGSHTIWSSRHHRKGLVLPEFARAVPIAEMVLRSLWMPATLNWWIGCVFAIGSLLFAIASLLTLVPAWAAAWSLEPSAVNAIYFAGSIPFTTAAYLQLFQAANSGEPSLGQIALHWGRDKPHLSDAGGVSASRTPNTVFKFALRPSRSAPSRIRVVGWRPHDVGWLSCALQFVGTILFNVNTFDAMVPSVTWSEQDLRVWVPNIIGSILFLLSGYLAFTETCHSWWAWKPNSISWWVVFINLLGCVGFLGSALLSFVSPGPPHPAAMQIAVVFTLQGALCFLAGSLLMLPETAGDASVPVADSQTSGTAPA